MGKVLVLRQIIVTKEEAAILRVALAALGEREGVLSSDGEAVLKTLIAKTEAVLAKFPG
jgi:hypothetical protein